MGGKIRADQLLVDQGLVETRSQARSRILAGEIWADGVRVDKAGQMLPADAALEERRRSGRYVSRGGLKLEGALADFSLKVEGARALDVGASTGGFTDCLLQHGAAEVTAVDVGYGQLHWRLRQDPRVRVIERTNARLLTPDLVGGPFSLVVIDVSFISLALILPAVLKVLSAGGEVLALVKPQFELGPEKVGRGGVVRDPVLQAEAVERVAGLARSLGLSVLGTAPARLKGPQGNQEYFLRLGPAA
jgi:23S rRNA (cytidine1920-2'-O)/16S rRNA (cytidine1409-2'-O)-methyltransferase